MSTEAHPRAPGARQRVLAIDDDPAILRLMNTVLSRDYDVALAADGEEGLGLALSWRPDLILSDFNMPGMTGRDLLRRLRAEPSLEDVPVVVVSGHEDSDLRLELLRDGAQDFLDKPFSVGELRVRIANLIRMKSARELLQHELHSRERNIGALVAEVTARRAALESALAAAQLARDQADRANQAKTTFLKLVSHELRTPLTVLGFSIDRWRKRAETGGKPASAEMGRVDRALDDLKSIVEGVIDYTRIQSGRLEPQLESVDLVALIGELRRGIEARVAYKGLHLEIEVADGAKRVTIDPGIVSVILGNLIDNAVRHTESGWVRVRAFRQSGSQPGSDAGLVLTVSDSGPGIDVVDLERVFQPFEHGVRIENKSTRGLGLGLAIVGELVTALGGRLTIQSEKGTGSTFTVALPAP